MKSLAQAIAEDIQQRQPKTKILTAEQRQRAQLRAELYRLRTNLQQELDFLAYMRKTGFILTAVYTAKDEPVDFNDHDNWSSNLVTFVDSYSGFYWGYESKFRFCPAVLHRIAELQVLLQK